MSRQNYTAIIEKAGDGDVSLCPELDVASQGPTVEEATASLKEAMDLFLECADPEEAQRRFLTSASGCWRPFRNEEGGDVVGNNSFDWYSGHDVREGVL